MYTVCIAEDEYYVQKSIEARIRSLPLELEIKGVASDGVEAEKMYHEFHPDLFLVDICMPQCSGLEFIEKIRNDDPECDTVFIIVSSYYDYENMRKAININVFDYLRKPIVPSEFLDIIERAVCQVKEQANKIGGGQKLVNIRMMEDYLAEHQNMEMSGTLLILMKRKAIEPIQNLKNELLQVGECTEIQLKNTGLIELLIFENQQITDRQVEKIVLSNRENGIIVFHRQFKQVRIEQDLKMAEAKMSCHYFTNRFFYSISGDVSERDFSDISYIFLKKNLLDTDIHMDRFWTEASKMMNEEHLCHFFKQYIFCLVKKYNEEKILFPEQLKRDLLLFSMVRFQTVDEIREYLQENTLQYFKCVKEKRPTELIDQISEYIHTNYAEPLNLNDLAAVFYISPSYLSHLFAKKKKMTIVKYIGTVRLEKSVEYLKNTELSIADIAERTGFSDGNYFAKAFKKKYGISPTDYRKMT